MKQGLLWYERGAEADLESCLVRAVAYFAAKYGHPPACCYIHPDLCPQERTSASGVRLIPNTRVLKNHFWLEFK